MTNDDIRQIVFATIRENPGEKTAIVLMQKACEKIKNNVHDTIETQEIFDDVTKTLRYYNDFVTEKKIKLPIVGETYFTLVEMILNALIGEILYENKRS